MFADLRERVADRLIFRFGTAIATAPDLEIERPQGRPSGIEFGGAAFARGRVAIDAAAWAQPGAVVLAQRRVGKVEEYVLTHHRGQIDLVARDLDRVLVLWCCWNSSSTTETDVPSTSR